MKLPIEMEVLPIPVLAELLAMLPYRDVIKFELLSHTLHDKLTNNASLIAAFLNMRCEVPQHVHVVKASFLQLKGVLKTLDSKQSGGIALRSFSSSRSMNVNNFSEDKANRHAYCAELSSLSKEASYVVTSVSLYKAVDQRLLTAVLFVSYDPVSAEEVEESAGLYAQALSPAAVGELEKAGVVSVSAYYDFETEWKALFLHAAYGSSLRPVLWVQMGPGFSESITIVFNKLLLARYVYLYSADTHRTQVYLSMRGAEMDLLAS